MEETDKVVEAMFQRKINLEVVLIEWCVGCLSVYGYMLKVFLDVHGRFNYVRAAQMSGLCWYGKDYSVGISHIGVLSSECQSKHCILRSVTSS